MPSSIGFVSGGKQALIAGKDVVKGGGVENAFGPWFKLIFELFTATEHRQQAVWCFELRDRERPALKLGDELQLT